MGLAIVNDKPRLVYLKRLNELFSEGPDLAVGMGPMVGLSMFSGGGNFDRGLEEGSAVAFHHAIDRKAPTVHTQLANARDPSKLQCYYGSVGDYMSLLLSGVEPRLIARIGTIHFIAAGSPCPGTYCI